MSKLIHIPKIGHVEFPHDMPDAEIAKHASRLHSDARSAGISSSWRTIPRTGHVALRKTQGSIHHYRSDGEVSASC